MYTILCVEICQNIRLDLSVIKFHNYITQDYVYVVDCISENRQNNNLTNAVVLFIS